MRDTMRSKQELRGLWDVREGGRVGIDLPGGGRGGALAVLDRLGLLGEAMPVAGWDVAGRSRLVGEVAAEARRLLLDGDRAGCDLLLAEVERLVG
jgi:hypothetical protein